LNHIFYSFLPYLRALVPAVSSSWNALPQDLSVTMTVPPFLLSDHGSHQVTSSDRLPSSQPYHPALFSP
jgi:hypothetical protein